MDKISVLGAGSWGTTIAGLLAQKGFKAVLWARSSSLATSVTENRENKLYLPGVKLPENLEATSSLEEALESSTLVVCAVPSHGVRAVFEPARDLIPKGSIVVSATKGIEDSTLLTPAGILKELLRGALTRHPSAAPLPGTRR
jgi:glycerol-3-phosphate dehydrogenase (NAD(P)+)